MFLYEMYWMQKYPLKNVKILAIKSKIVQVVSVLTLLFAARYVDLHLICLSCITHKRHSYLSKLDY